MSEIRVGRLEGSRRGGCDSQGRISEVYLEAISFYTRRGELSSAIYLPATQFCCLSTVSLLYFTELLIWLKHSAVREPLGQSRSEYILPWNTQSQRTLLWLGLTPVQLKQPENHSLTVNTPGNYLFFSHLGTIRHHSNFVGSSVFNVWSNCVGLGLKAARLTLFQTEPIRLCGKAWFHIKKGIKTIVFYTQRTYYFTGLESCLHLQLPYVFVA